MRMSTRISGCRRARRSSLRGAAVLLLISSVLGAAGAEWPADPAENFPVADRVSEQVIPIPSPTADGGCYIGWFDHASGNYDVYLQRLDRFGNEVWPHNGILVSGHPQNSWLVTWDLTTDSADNAILVFGDARGGGDFDIQAYKVSPAGDLLWGPDGVTLSTNDDFEPGACVTEATDGDLVFAWARLPDAGPGTIQLQRLSPAGIERFAHGGLAVVTPASESPSFPDIVPSLAGDVVVSWVRDISQYMSPRHIQVQRFASDGSPVWGSVLNLFDEVAVPLGYHPKIQSDEVGGLVAAWHASVNNLHSSRFQHVDADGGELYPHNGIPVSTAAMMHVDPTLAYHPESGEAFIFWNERNAGQTLWGIYGQRISNAGLRQWGDQGRALLPVNDTYQSYPRAVSCTGGAMVFVAEEPAAAYSEHLIGMRVDQDGAMVWPDSPIEISSVLSSKARYPVIVTGDEMAVLVWEDDRNGTVDLFAQNVNADGSLGVDPGAVPDAEADRWVVLRSHPNPFSIRTQLTLRLDQPLAGARLLIRDTQGRMVRTFSAGDLPAGEWRVAWDGTGMSGERLPAGVYFYQLGDGQSSYARGRGILLE